MSENVTPSIEEIKRKALQDAERIELLSVMGMNRHQRRAIAKFNKRKKIPGTMKPYVKAAPKTETQA